MGVDIVSFWGLVADGDGGVVASLGETSGDRQWGGSGVRVSYRRLGDGAADEGDGDLWIEKCLSEHAAWGFIWL